MTIALDTNVVISGVLKPYSHSGTVLRLAAEGIIQVAYDLRILAEYRDVLAQPKFNFSQATVDAFLAQIEQEGTWFLPGLRNFTCLIRTMSLSWKLL